MAVSIELEHTKFGQETMYFCFLISKKKKKGKFKNENEKREDVSYHHEHDFFMLKKMNFGFFMGNFSFFVAC